MLIQTLSVIVKNGNFVLFQCFLGLDKLSDFD